MSWKHAIFLWVFWLNMLENDSYNLQIKFWLHISSNISKSTKLENHGIATLPHDLPTLKAYPSPGVGGRFFVVVVVVVIVFGWIAAHFWAPVVAIPPSGTRVNITDIWNVSVAILTHVHHTYHYHCIVFFFLGFCTRFPGYRLSSIFQNKNTCKVA